MAEQRTKRRGKRAADNQTRLRDRENRAVAMHAYAGMTFMQIAAKFAEEGDPCTESAVSKMITRVLDRATFAGASQMRALKRQQLTLAMTRVMAILTAGESTPEQRLKAAHEVAYLVNVEAKLFGLNSPEVVQLEVSINRVLEVVREMVPDEEFERIAERIIGTTSPGAAREEPGTPAAPASSLAN